MSRTYQDKQQSYRKRLFIFCPIAVACVMALFITSDVVPYSEIEKGFGWFGPTQIVQEITIIPDNLLEELKETTQLQTLASMDADILDETGPEEGGDSPPVKEEKPFDDSVVQLSEEVFRQYPSHTEIPYSEEFVILYMIDPAYPPAELLDGIEGDVTVEVLVNDKGLVENAWVLVALGPRNFEAASLEAVRQFRFKPPVRDGVPMPMWIRFQIRFRLFS
ncbi:MAG: energy transducer TonB [bacterium]|nr:energy transducer TonB [bacterium]